MKNIREKKKEELQEITEFSEILKRLPQDKRRQVLGYAQGIDGRDETTPKAG